MTKGPFSIEMDMGNNCMIYPKESLSILVIFTSFNHRIALCHFCVRFCLYFTSEYPKLRFRLPYPQLFGGVTAIKRAHFEKVNGHSNKFFGWGGEDDDMFRR